MAHALYNLLNQGGVRGLLNALDHEGRLDLEITPYAWKDSWIARQMPAPGQAWTPSALERAVLFELRGALGNYRLTGLALHLPEQRAALDFQHTQTQWDAGGFPHRVTGSVQATAFLGLPATPAALGRLDGFVAWLAAVNRQHTPTGVNEHGHRVAGPELAVTVDRAGQAEMGWHKGHGLSEAQRARLDQELAQWLADPTLAAWATTMKAAGQVAHPGYPMMLGARELFGAHQLTPEAPVVQPPSLIQRVGDHLRRRRRP